MLRTFLIFGVLIGISVSSCKGKRQLSNNQEIDVMRKIIHDHFSLITYSYNNDTLEYYINRNVCFNDSLNVYAFLHVEYIYQLTDGRRGNKTVTTANNPLEIDFDKLIPRMRDTFHFPSIEYIDDIPIEIVRGIDYDKRTFTFSPLIPTNEKGSYVVLLERSKRRDTAFYFFKVVKRKKGFDVELLDWNDFIYRKSPRFNGEEDLLQSAFERLER